jgi:hypothetical protein
MASRLKLSSAHALDLPRPDHNIEQAWAAWPTTGLAGRRTRPVSTCNARSAQRLSGGQTSAKCTPQASPAHGALV